MDSIIEKTLKESVKGVRGGPHLRLHAINPTHGVIQFIRAAMTDKTIPALCKIFGDMKFAISADTDNDTIKVEINIDRKTFTDLVDETF